MSVDKDTTLNLRVNVCDRYILVDEEDSLYKEVINQYHTLNDLEFKVWFKEQSKAEDLTLSLQVVENYTAHPSSFHE